VMQELAEARLGLAGKSNLRDDPETIELVRWISDAVEDRDKRPFIFGRQSMTRLAELGSAREWMHWLKSAFESAQAEADTQLREEQARSRTSGASTVEKWRIRAELVSLSHSIRPGPLTWWNRLESPVRLFPVKSSDRLNIEIRLTDDVLLDELVPRTLDLMNKLGIAFNIGTFGLFWWEFPRRRIQFVDSVVDLVADSEVRIESRATQIDYGHLALKEDDLRNVALVLAGLPRTNEVAGHEAFNLYSRAIALVAKSDAHLQFWGPAFEDLASAIRGALRYYLHWDGRQPPSQALAEAIPDEVAVLDEDDRRATLLQLDAPSLSPSLESVGKLKTLCDALFTRQLRRVARARSLQEP
jgi:hypothetical protein